MAYSLGVWEKLPQSTPPRGGGRSALTESGYPAGPHVQPGRRRQRVRRLSLAGASGCVKCLIPSHCVPSLSGGWDTWAENGTPGVSRVVSGVRHRGPKWDTGAHGPQSGRPGPKGGGWVSVGSVACRDNSTNVRLRQWRGGQGRSGSRALWAGNGRGAASSNPARPDDGFRRRRGWTGLTVRYRLAANWTSLPGNRSR